MSLPITFRVAMPPAKPPFPPGMSPEVEVQLSIDKDQFLSSIQGTWRFIFPPNLSPSLDVARPFNISTIQIDGKKSERLPHEKMAKIFENTAKAIEAKKYAAAFQGPHLIITTQK